MKVLNHLTSRWGLVLVALLVGTRRFSQPRRKIGGAGARMLAQTFRNFWTATAWSNATLTRSCRRMWRAR